MTATAMRLVTVVVVAVLVSMTLGQPVQTNAAGGPLYQVSLDRFCRSHVFGNPESATLKFSVTITSLGPEATQGTLFVTAAAHSPAVNPYFQLSVNHDPVVLEPGESVRFVAVAKGINLARKTLFQIGTTGAEGSAYTATPYYANAAAIPTC